LFTPGNEKSRTLVALPDAASRKSIRKIIQEAGYTHCREVASLPDLEEKLGAGEVDLLVTTLNDRGWDCGSLIQHVRQGHLGNPFLLVMMLLDEPSPSVVNRVVNCGADDLLLAPWLDRLVLGRLETLLHSRKRFLVTHDYVGPERRSQARPGANSAPTIDVPNPMHWLTVAAGNREDLNRAVDTSREDLNRDRIKSCGNQLRFLADRVVANFATGGHAAIIPDIMTMLQASEELALRAADTHFAPAIELAEGLRTICQRLAREERTARASEVGVLPSLADAVVRALYNSEPDPLPAAMFPGA
jgi:DNA-binding response OmpR family regulator